MPDTHVETACLRAFGVNTPTSEPRSMLHKRMAQVRIGTDSGMSPEDSVEAATVRRKRDEARLRAVLQMNMGSAMGMGTPSEMLFDVALPTCTRWGDQVLQQYAVRGFGTIDVKDTMHIAPNTRPAVPGPMQFSPKHKEAATPDLMGPHASVEAMYCEPLPICSYGQRVEEARAMAASAITASFSAGSAYGLKVEDAESSDDEDTVVVDNPRTDRIAEAEDGKRVWPPLALHTSSHAIEAQSSVEQLLETFEQMGVKKELLGAVGGIYSSAVEFVLSREKLEQLHRKAFASLGIGAPEATRESLLRARRRADVLAAAAHVMGYKDLGNALGALASGPLTDCASKPWS